MVYIQSGPLWCKQSTIHNPQGPKKKYFAARQESCRKDVERAFGVLQSKWAIITGPARVWSKQVLHDIMTTCIIMHNMIIEDERELNVPVTDYRDAPIPDIEMAREHVRFQEFLARHRKIKDKSAHYELRDALIDICGRSTVIRNISIFNGQFVCCSLNHVSFMFVLIYILCLYDECCLLFAI